MYSEGRFLIGKSGDEPVWIRPSMACRHGLISGATGTGKTTTIKVLAESFSQAGIPVFMADVKGDLAATAFAGGGNEKAEERVQSMKLSDDGFTYRPFPVNLWDVYGESGMPLRTTVSELGPLLLSRILDLNDTQSDVLTLIFRIADEEGLLLIDLKDLKAMVRYVSEKRAEYAPVYGNMAPQSLAAIQRAVTALESEGAECFIGEPAIGIRDWLTKDADGRGTVQILDCRRLFLHPRMYAMFTLWLMSELFETLPEEGDLPAPKMVFFFDEAHLLFHEAPKLLREKIEQVVKLIRSKGVGIYFVTQSPSDLPGEVLAQLGNKIQHALRAYTPAEMKKLKAAAMAFRENPAFDTMEVLQTLGTGHALVSVLDEKGVPTVALETTVLPPESRMGTVTEAERSALIQGSPLYEKYLDGIDRDSAYEFLERRRLENLKAQEETKAAEKAAKEQAAADKKADRLRKNAARTASGTIGREIGKKIGGTIGGSFGRRLGGNLGAELGRGLIGTFFGN